MSSSARDEESITSGVKREAIQRESVVHHEPLRHSSKPKHSAMRVKRQSQSAKQKYHSSGSLNKDGSAHSHVGFDKVDVLEFPETVGRDVVPSGNGPPVQLSRDEVGHKVETVDEFESTHTNHRINLKMSRKERERKLREEGFTSEDFLPVEQEAEEIRNSREKSSHEHEPKKMKKTKKKGQRGLGRLNPFAGQKKR